MSFPQNNGMQVPDADVPKAGLACFTCRKQKRKCSKTLPACTLCERMNRHCDYSSTTPAPTSEEFSALQVKVMELENRLNGGNDMVNPADQYATPQPAAPNGQEGLATQAPMFSPPQEFGWHGVQNRFPAIVFLDSESFKYGGINIPKSPAEIPPDVLDILGDASHIQNTINEYFNTVHKWLPIVSSKRLTRNMANPLWEAGPDLALLFLCMKLIITRPHDGLDCAASPVYTAAKRFLSMMEATGTVSLLVLQSNLLVTWYEYGQAIYPAAWMSAGWCVRYGNMLGINGHKEAAQLLGPLGTWTEQEERRRTWWGVLLADRVISLGSQGHIINSQEPRQGDILPADDTAWDNGELSGGMQQTVSDPIENPVASFPRLCQASIMLGKVLFHHHGTKLPGQEQKPHFIDASMLYGELSTLSRILREEADKSKDYLTYTAALALTYSGLCTLCDSYSCLKGCTASTPEEAAMQAQAIDGLKTVSRSVVDFCNDVNLATPQAADLDRVNPIMMDALYSAASNYAWIVRESGDASSQLALDSIRYSLRRIGARWRNAAEYLRILEAREFTYAVNGAVSSS